MHVNYTPRIVLVVGQTAHRTGTTGGNNNN
nr:MAG TPA: hypothetical protein [Caudoviricetes sp.]